MPTRPTAVVTGTTSGIGAELAVLLAAQGYDLVLVNRSAERTSALLARIKLSNPEATVAVYEADLADPAQVRSAAGRIRDAHPTIQALFNNAGVLVKDTRRTDAGHELHLAVNVLAPFALTVLLRSPLASGARQHGRSIVVTASSNAVFMTHDFEVGGLDEPRKPGLFGAYAQSKIAASMIMQALAPAYASDDIDLYAVDPGGTRTAMTASDAAPFFVRWIRNFLPGPEKGAQQLLAVLDQGYAGRTGLLISGGKVRKLPRTGTTPEDGDELLALCAQLTGVEATTINTGLL